MTSDAATGSANDAAPESGLAPVFGRLVTAMVTPFDHSGRVNTDMVKRLATYLVDEQDNDAIVVNGTTGESPTTTDEEKAQVVAAAVEAVGDRAQILAGVGTFATHHTLELARQAEQAGADGLLVVTPYYSKPPQEGLLDHFVHVADSTQLPVMLYDIPGRAATALESSTIVSLAEHPRIVAVKDAKGDIISSSQVLRDTTLHYYAGDDALTLPLMSVGGVGVVGTSTHFTGSGVKRMMSEFLAGNIDGAAALNATLLPAFTAVFATQGVMMVKAGLRARDLDAGGCRPPLPAAPQDLVDELLRALRAADCD